MSQDRPTAAELLQAVREFLQRDVMPALDSRLAFHARVAANVLAIVERELAEARELDDVELTRLRALLNQDGRLADLNRELATRIRDGSLDDRWDDVLTHLLQAVRDKLTISNPRYLGGSPP